MKLNYITLNQTEVKYIRLDWPKVDKTMASLRKESNQDI